MTGKKSIGARPSIGSGGMAIAQLRDEEIEKLKANGWRLSKDGVRYLPPKRSKSERNPQFALMSSLEFKDEIHAKGWTLNDVAARWDISISRMHQIAKDERRPAYYDDAIRGLPAPSEKNK